MPVNGNSYKAPVQKPYQSYLVKDLTCLLYFLVSVLVKTVKFLPCLDILEIEFSIV